VQVTFRCGRAIAVGGAVLLTAMLLLMPAMAQVPPEWPAAAQAVLTELEKDTPMAARPFTEEMRQGGPLARKWRQHTSRSSQILFAEYLAMVTLCRLSGCAKDMIAGKSVATRGAEVQAEKARNGGADGTVEASLRWLDGLSGSGAAQRNAVLWARDKDATAADFEVSNIYTLGWLLAREQPDAKGQAELMSIFGLYVHGKGWFRDRCLDISKVAALLDAPPKVERCR